MKKYLTSLLLCGMTAGLFMSSCKKDSNVDSSDCKTCRALATNNKPEVSRSICSDAGLEEFYSQYSNQEITCR